ncbi:MAG: RluA family pseudouridine synthase [Bacteroidota bacterium]
MAKKATAIEVLYEDDHLIVLNKAAGLLSIPDRFDLEKTNLYHLLRSRVEKPYIVHRLDRETSGIICFAKGEVAHKKLSEQFAEHHVEKYYLTLVEGHPHPGAGRIDKPIGKHPSIAGKMIIHKKGKASITDYQTLETFKNYSLVEANIHTGRTHQIRVHFEGLGHPLVVDAVYGRQEAFFLSSLKLRRYKLRRDAEERPLMSRTTLHSWRLRLDHPHTSERMEWTAPPPKDFKALLQQLRKWAAV